MNVIDALKEHLAAARKEYDRVKKSTRGDINRGLKAQGRMNIARAEVIEAEKALELLEREREDEDA